MIKQTEGLVSKRLDYASQKHFDNRIVRYFPESDLRNGHDGLRKVAGKEDVDLLNLKNGEFAVFVNKKKNALKMFAAGYVVAHLRMPNNERLNPKVIALLPCFFNGTEIDYNSALEATMKKQFPSFFGS